MHRNLAVAALAVALFAIGAGQAAGSPDRTGPDTHAPCVAILSWLNTHHPELTDDLNRSEIAHLFKELADESGFEVGEFYVFFAHTHVGDGACDG